MQTKRRELYHKPGKRKARGFIYRKKQKILCMLLCAMTMFSCMVMGAAAYANMGVEPRTAKPEPVYAELEHRLDVVTVPNPTGNMNGDRLAGNAVIDNPAESNVLVEETTQIAKNDNNHTGIIYKEKEISISDTVTSEDIEPTDQTIPEVEERQKSESDRKYLQAELENDEIVNEGGQAEEGITPAPQIQEDAEPEQAEVPVEEKTQEELDAEEATEEPWHSMEFSEDVLPGMEGDVVGVLQSRLKELGYLENESLTNQYGPETQMGVSLFQRNHGLPSTGEANVETLQLLLSDDAALYQMSPDETGEDIRSMQERLTSLGYTVEATGLFDESTEEMVMLFQETNGLVENGIVTLGTRAVLFSELALDREGKLPKLINVGVESLIAVAEKQMGKPYILGAKGADAFDCSGLIYYCLNQSGYEIGYQTSGDWANSAYTTVEGMNNLIRGDIICYQGHVGIYLGNGKMLDASSSEGQVRVTGNIFQSDYWISHFICGKRVY